MESLEIAYISIITIDHNTSKSQCIILSDYTVNKQNIISKVLQY